jgi:hypothetical protein
VAIEAKPNGLQIHEQTAFIADTTNEITVLTFPAYTKASASSVPLIVSLTPSSDTYDSKYHSGK